MKTRPNEIVSYFKVENEANELKKVVIIQELLPYYRKENAYRKSFRLETLEGDIVYPTNDPNILQLANGYILKKTNK